MVHCITLWSNFEQANLMASEKTLKKVQTPRRNRSFNTNSVNFMKKVVEVVKRGSLAHRIDLLS